MATLQVIGHNLPELGKLIEIRNANTLETKAEMPTIVVVMDMSGSMGDLPTNVLCGCVPDAMEQAGYNLEETQVHVITFAAYASVLLNHGQALTAQELRNNYYRGNGNTNMNGVFELLKPELIYNKHVCLFGISDGEIQDILETLHAAQQCYKSYATHIDVMMLRLKTSQGANPDTRALACLGQFGTNGIHSIHDIITYDGSKWTDRLTSLLKSNMNPQHMLRVTANGIRRTPCDEPTDMLYLPIENTIVFLAPSSTSMIAIDGTDEHKYEVVSSVTLSESALQFFCDYASSKIELQQILGYNTTVMQHWFTKFDSLTLDSNGATPPKKDLRERLEQLKCKMSSYIKTAIHDVLTLANQDRLRNLNRTQQEAADYLRQSSSTALARRNGKNLQQQQSRGETDGIAQQATRMMHEYKLLQQLQDQSQECSFYSIYSNKDVFDCIADADFSSLTDINILRLVGLLGVCYHHVPNDFVDPYVFHVHDMLGGGYLNVADLREANSQKINGQTAELCAPGSQITITGVVPLRCLDPQLFDLMFQHGLKLLEAHSCLNMRRMLAPVRSDMLGERIGVLMCIMNKYGKSQLQQEVSTWDQVVFDDMVTQLKLLLDKQPHKSEYAILVSKITNSESIRDMLTGIDCISCIQKPMIALLCHCFKNPDVDQNYISQTLCMLYEFETYHRARYAFNELEQRGDALLDVFGIDLKKMLTWFPIKELPYIQACDNNGIRRHEALREHIRSIMNKDTQWFSESQQYFSITTIHGQRANWMPDPNCYRAYFQFLTQCDTSRLNMFDIITPYRVSMSMVAGIYASEEKHRIIDGQNQMFVWNDVDSENAFVRRLIQHYYFDFYEKEAKLELDRRDNQRIMTQIYSMARGCLNEQEFCDLLQKTIPNREHTGYGVLLRELIEYAHHDSHFTNKLAVLITGRTFQEGKEVFAQGNFDPKFWSFESYFTPAAWNILVERKHTYGIYQYRESNTKNRHGHNNNHPSEWAVTIYPTLRNIPKHKKR